MNKQPLDIPSLGTEDFSKVLPASLNFPGLPELFPHFTQLYLRQIAAKMNSYTWFRFVEAESKNLILKRTSTRLLYKLLNKKDYANICAGNENAVIEAEKAVGLSSRGVNYKAVNEDGFGIFERDDELLLICCDGVGDCLVGEVASYVILSQFQNRKDADMADVLRQSVVALAELGKEIVGEIPEFYTFPNEISQAAVTGVSIKGNQAQVAQVGDVLFYHYRKGRMQLLDQNRKWLDLDALSKMFADEHYLAQRHIISNAVGRNYDPYWVPTDLDLEKGDIILLASDGLETLHPKDLADILEKGGPLKKMLTTLYDRALEANQKWNTVGAPIYTKPDNISICLYRHE